MNVLSLFDGMSCGRQALERANIQVDKYYASEIDKYAIQVTQHNYPDTIQLGSVLDVDITELEPIDLLIGGSPCQSFSFAGKRNGMTTSCSEEIYTLERYLELKTDGFQFEGESYLFWEYMRILTDIRKHNPDVLFLLENVEMGNKWERILSEAIGIYGVHINSALVSAQSRKRIYWTNIRVKKVGLFGELHSDIPQPEDRGILLKDILEDEVDNKYYLSDKMLNSLSSTNSAWGERFKPMDGNTCKSKTLTSRYFKMGKTDPYIDETVCVAMRGRGQNNEYIIGGQMGFKKDFRASDKAQTLLARDCNGMSNTGINVVVCVAMRGRNPDNPSDRTVGAPTEQRLESRRDGKTNTITTVQKDNLIMQLNPSKESGGVQPYQQNRVYDTEGISPALCAYKSDLIIKIPEATAKGYVEIEPGECFDAENINSKTRRGRKMADKSNCLMAKETDFMRYEYFEPNESIKHPKTVSNARIRRLTPLECERLQTMKDNFTAVVSDTQRYKMIGNGWTIDVIAHIFSFIDERRKKNIG